MFPIRVRPENEIDVVPSEVEAVVSVTPSGKDDEDEKFVRLLAFISMASICSDSSV